MIACGYTLEHQDEVAGLICEDFAYQVPAPDAVLAILKGVSHVAPHAHVFKLKNEDFSRAPAVVAAMNADPLIADESQPAETMAELARADLDRRAPGDGDSAQPARAAHLNRDGHTRAPRRGKGTPECGRGESNSHSITATRT